MALLILHVKLKTKHKIELKINNFINKISAINQSFQNYYAILDSKFTMKGF